MLKFFRAINPGIPFTFTGEIKSISNVMEDSKLVSFEQIEIGIPSCLEDSKLVSFERIEIGIPSCLEDTKIVSFERAGSIALVITIE